MRGKAMQVRDASGPRSGKAADLSGGGLSGGGFDVGEGLSGGGLKAGGGLQVKAQSEALQW